MDTYLDIFKFLQKLKFTYLKITVAVKVFKETLAVFFSKLDNRIAGFLCNAHAEEIVEIGNLLLYIMEIGKFYNENDKKETLVSVFCNAV